MYSTAATFYKTRCTKSLASVFLLFAHPPSPGRCRTFIAPASICTALFALLEKVRNAVIAANCSCRKVLMTQALVPAFRKIAVTQGPIAMTAQIFHGFKNDNRRTQKPVCNTFALNSASLSEKALRETLRSLPSLQLSIFPRSFLPSFCQVSSLSLRMFSSSHCILRCGRTSDDYVEAKEINRMIIFESNGAKKET